ncbi:MAG: hypothetical protein PHQ23_05970, partial [Candidatus Wallbacteria bacterium]|nr:hypothetical protein [Candidatus Wallbacteria bacterium]
GSTWEVISTVDGADPVENVGEYSSIALDASGRPRISYWDASNSRLKYARWDGAAWVIRLVDAGDFGTSPSSITVDPLDFVRIAYFDATNGKLKLAIDDGVGFGYQDVDSGGVGAFPSLRMSGNDMHLSYQDVADTALKYARWDNGAGLWTKDILDNSADTGYFSSIGINALGNPSIAYYALTDSSLRCARYTGIPFIFEVVDDGANGTGVGQYTSIALDSNNRPHISHFDDANNDLKYSVWNGAAWVSEMVDNSSFTIGQYTSIKLNTADIPYISYYDSSNGELQIANRNGGAWGLIGNKDTVDDGSGGANDVGRYSSLFLDGDTVCIAYYDATSSALKFARDQGAGIWDKITLDNAASVGTYASLGMDASGNFNIAYYDATSFDLKFCWYDGRPWEAVTIDNSGDVGKYSSLMLDTVELPCIAYYDETNGNLKFAKSNGTIWTLYTADNSANDVGSHCSLGYRRDNTWRIAYYDATAGDLKWAQGTVGGTSWSVWGILDSVGDVGKYSSVFIDDNYKYYITYYDETTDNLKYMHWDGATWLTEYVGVPGKSRWENTGKYSSVGFDGSVPEVVYWDEGAGKLKYAYRNAVPWKFFDIDTIGNVGLYTSIAVSGSGYEADVFISYFDSTNQQLKCAKQQAEVWTLDMVDDGGDGPLGTNVGMYSSIALDTGVPHISYYDFTNRDLKHATYTGAWVKEVVDSANDVGSYSAITAKDGLVWISYRDETTDDLKRAEYNGATWDKAIVDSAGDVGKYTDISLDTADSWHIAYWDETNLKLKHAWFDNIPWKSVIVDNVADSDTGQYSSIARTTGGAWRIAYTNFKVTNPKSYKVRMASSADGETWDPLEDACDITAVAPGYPSLAVGTDGRPRIAYVKSSGDPQYAYKAAGWTVSSLTNKFDAAWTSIALDSSNRYRMAMYNSNTKKLMYSHNIDGFNNIPVAIETTEVAVRSSALTMDPRGAPHAAYYHLQEKELRYAYHDGDSVQVLIVDTGEVGTGNVGQYCSAHSTAGGYPMISYYDAGNASLKMAYALPNPVNTEEIDIFRMTLNKQTDVGQYTSIFVWETEECYISFYDAHNGDIKYIHWRAATGGTVELGQFDKAGDVGRFSSITVDRTAPNARTVHVAYYDATNTSLKHAWRVSEVGDPHLSWNIEVIDGAGAEDVGQYACIKYSTGEVAGDDHLYISYYDATNRKLKYAHQKNGGAWEINVMNADNGTGPQPPFDVPDTWWGKYSSMAVDTDRGLHFGYWIENTQDVGYTYGQRTGETFIFQVHDVDGPADVGRFGCLAQAPAPQAWVGAQFPHLIYWDDTNYQYLYAIFVPPTGETSIDAISTWDISNPDDSNEVYHSGQFLTVEAHTINDTTEIARIFIKRRSDSFPIVPITTMTTVKTRVGISRDALYEYRWNTTGLLEGGYSVEVNYGVDTDPGPLYVGKQWDSISVTIDNTPPTVYSSSATGNESGYYVEGFTKLIEENATIVLEFDEPMLLMGLLQVTFGGLPVTGEWIDEFYWEGYVDIPLGWDGNYALTASGEKDWAYNTMTVYNKNYAVDAVRPLVASVVTIPAVNSSNDPFRNEQVVTFRIDFNEPMRIWMPPTVKLGGVPVVQKAFANEPTNGVWTGELTISSAWGGLGEHDLQVAACRDYYGNRMDTDEAYSFWVDALDAYNNGLDTCDDSVTADKDEIYRAGQQVRFTFNTIHDFIERATIEISSSDPVYSIGPVLMTKTPLGGFEEFRYTYIWDTTGLPSGGHYTAEIDYGYQRFASIEVIIDNERPVLDLVTVTTSALPSAEPFSAEVVTVVADVSDTPAFGEGIDTAEALIVSFSGIGNATGSWNASGTKWTGTRNIALNAFNGITTMTISGARDKARNTVEIFTDTFEVDSSKPVASSITSVPANPPAVFSSELVKFTVDFTDLQTKMDTSRPARVILYKAGSGSYPISGSWVNNLQWTGEITIPLGWEGNCQVRAGNAYDLVGFCCDTKEVSFTVDSGSPEVSSVTVIPGPGLPLPIGKAVFTVNFFEIMDAGAPLTVKFNNVELTGDWAGALFWTGEIDIPAGWDGVKTMSISGGQDLKGNVMVTDTSQSFLVDANRPIVIQADKNKSVPFKLETVLFTVYFSDTGVGLKPGSPITITYADAAVSPTVGWSGNTWTGDLLIPDGLNGSYPLRINDVEDDAGNVMLTKEVFFQADTLKPTITVYATPALPKGTAGNPFSNGRITFEVQFSENMNTAINPTVSFGAQAVTKISYSGNTWRGYIVIDTSWGGLNEHSLTVSGAKDLNANQMLEDSSNTFWVNSNDAVLLSFGSCDDDNPADDDGVYRSGMNVRVILKTASDNVGAAYCRIENPAVPLDTGLQPMSETHVDLDYTYTYLFAPALESDNYKVTVSYGDGRTATGYIKLDNTKPSIGLITVRDWQGNSDPFGIESVEVIVDFTDLPAFAGGMDTGEALSAILGGLPVTGGFQTGLRWSGEIMIPEGWSGSKTLWISNAYDNGGNMIDPESSGPYAMDTVRPTVTNVVTVHPTRDGSFALPFNNGYLTFEITFSRAMDTTVNPVVLFGGHTATKSSYAGTLWKGWVHITGGWGPLAQHTLEISAARDAVGNPMNTDSTRKYWIEPESGDADFSALNTRDSLSASDSDEIYTAGRTVIIELVTANDTAGEATCEVSKTDGGWAGESGAMSVASFNPVTNGYTYRYSWNTAGRAESNKYSAEVTFAGATKKSSIAIALDNTKPLIGGVVVSSSISPSETQPYSAEVVVVTISITDSPVFGGGIDTTKAPTVAFSGIGTVNGAYRSATVWSGEITVVPDAANGSYSLQISKITDRASNEILAWNANYEFDTTKPAVSSIQAIPLSPFQHETISVTIGFTDSGSSKMDQTRQPEVVLFYAGSPEVAVNLNAAWRSNVNWSGEVVVPEGWNGTCAVIVRNAYDCAGYAADTTQCVYTVDTGPPFVQSVTPVSGTTLPVGVNVFTVSFSEAMDTGEALTVLLSTEVVVGGWRTSTTWSGEIDIPSGWSGAKTLSLSGGRDPVLNVMASDSSRSYTVDNVMPGILSVTTTHSLGRTGTEINPFYNGFLTFEITFTEPMKTTVTPSVAFGTHSVSVVSFAGAVYQGRVTITSAWGPLAERSLEVSAACDAAGNPMVSDSSRSWWVESGAGDAIFQSLGTKDSVNPSDNDGIYHAGQLVRVLLATNNDSSGQAWCEIYSSETEPQWNMGTVEMTMIESNFDRATYEVTWNTNGRVECEYYTAEVLFGNNKLESVRISLDNTSPLVDAVLLTSGTLPSAEPFSAEVLTVTVDFSDEPDYGGMDTAQPVSASFGGIGSFTGSWIAASSWQGTMAVALDSFNGYGTLTVSAAKDQAANSVVSWNDTFEIDTTKPAVSGVIASVAEPFQQENVNFTVSFTDSGSKMDEGHAPTVVMQHTGSAEIAVAGGFSSNTTWFGSVIIPFGWNDTCAISITDARDRAGFAADPYAKVYTVDTSLPYIASVATIPAAPLPAGNTTFTLDFSETMDTLELPAVLFDGNTISGAWTDTNTWQGTYNISGINGLITLEVSSARDKAGNAMLADSSHGFVVDSIRPVITGVVKDKDEPFCIEPVIFTVSFSDTGLGMDTGVPAAVKLGTGEVLGAWRSATVWSGEITVPGGWLGSYALNISSAKDLAGNIIMPVDWASYQVDSVRPYVVSALTVPGANSAVNPFRRGTVSV